jgi:serine-type D-Ala-D-Ala carboxypeptidase/endopeptidase
MFMTSLCLLALSATSAPAPVDSEVELRAIVDRVVRPHLAKTVGLVVGVIQGERRVVVGYGKLSQDSGRAPDADTLFEIGSITKTFTSLLLADMVQRGEVKLEDPVRLYMPAGVRVPTRNGKEIRLIDLATHVSGLPRVPPELLMAAVFCPDPYKYYTPDALYRYLNTCELTRDVGAVWEYSNLGVGLLGHCLERKAGRPYEELIRERICKPLGMPSTCVNVSPNLRKRLAQGYSEPGESVEPSVDKVLVGCGGVRSTANDMLTYLAAQMGTLHTSLDSVMESTHAVRTGTDSSEVQQALGWLILKLPGGANPIVWHNGGTAGFESWAGFIKRSRTAVVVLTNCSDAEIADAIGLKLVAGLDLRATSAPASQPGR